MSVKELKMWFILAIVWAAVSVVGLIISVSLWLRPWWFIFTVITVIACVHLGAVGVFYVAEKEIEEEDRKAKELIEEFREFCAEEKQRKADAPFDEFEGGKK